MLFRKWPLSNPQPKLKSNSSRIQTHKSHTKGLLFQFSSQTTGLANTRATWLTPRIIRQQWPQYTTTQKNCCVPCATDMARRRHNRGITRTKQRNKIKNTDSSTGGATSSASRRNREDFRRWIPAVSRADEYIACKNTTSRLPAGATGIENLGNTCYMSAVLQMLSHTRALASYLLSDTHRENMNMCPPYSGSVAEEVAQVINVLWSRNLSFISPHRLRALLSKRRRDFGNSQPQDAHEFAILLLEWLHEDLSTMPDDQPDQENVDRSLMPYRSMKHSIITRLYHGLYRSTLFCAACGFESETFETFSIISLPLPANVRGSRCSLHYCVEQHVRGGLIHGWRCNKCDRLQDVVKKLELWHLPRVIIFHLKRFSFAGNSMRKTHGHVSFPLRDLDLSQLAIGPNPRSHGLVYDLCGVVEHHGSQRSGHYTAFCFNQPTARWFFMNDTTVKETSAVKVKEATAYMLCYVARENFHEK